jgi:ATP-dependent DNA helicase RecG
MHYPASANEKEGARFRLAFDELLLLQLSLIRRKRLWQKNDEGLGLKPHDEVVAGFVRSLPFELTGAQKRVLDEILFDIQEPRPMSRLLQGDVGSGKTAVAVAVLLLVAANGFQGAMMAPTEILAEQHFWSVSKMLTEDSVTRDEDGIISVDVDYLDRSLTVGLLTGSQSKKSKLALHERIASGEVDIVIGTHAVIQDEVDIPNLALAVVDEQHRFGVMQRAALRGKGKRPHLLAMTATPIPRSLIQTVYGDMDSSAIDEMPPGRLGIKTRWVESGKRNAAYGFIRKEVTKGRQAFIVCPLIEESEVLQTRAATNEYERLSREVFPDLNIGLLHGRMPFAEKESLMENFKSGELDVLVATPVVEVGIDIPNATVMFVDGAERFGLSQLHQFRGRVGRGEHQSYCLLLTDSPGEEAVDRLKIVEKVTDGFVLAEEDLRLRGPGDYLGTRQSGLPDFKVARITDQDILTLARHEALRILDADPGLSKQENSLLVTQVNDLSAVITGEMGG